MDIAKKYTGQEENTTAISEFKLTLQHVNMSFNIKGFPGNESDENAFRRCVDDKSAQAYCPERWKAIRAWIANTENVCGTNIFFSLTLSLIKQYVTVVVNEVLIFEWTPCDTYAK